jgi:hypothetical protein
MYWLTGCTSNGADWEALWDLLASAVVAFSPSLLCVSLVHESHKDRSYPFDDLNIAIEASRPTLDQRNIGRKAHLVDMTPSFEIIKSVENDCKRFEEINIELRILDVCMMRFDGDVRIEFRGCLLCDLQMTTVSANHPE